MAFTLVAKPTLSSAGDGVYTDGSTDGAITEPPTDGAYANTGDGWSAAYTLYGYPFWTLGSVTGDTSSTGGVPTESGALGVLIAPGYVGIFDSTTFWTRIEVPT